MTHTLLITNELLARLSDNEGDAIEHNVLARFGSGRSLKGSSRLSLRKRSRSGRRWIVHEDSVG